MPDISMCKNKICPFKNSCYRFLATPNPDRQSYMKFDIDEELECDAYDPITIIDIFAIPKYKGKKNDTE